MKSHPAKEQKDRWRRIQLMPDKVVDTLRSLSLFPWLVPPPFPSQPTLILSVWSSHRSPEFRAVLPFYSSSVVIGGWAPPCPPVSDLARFLATKKPAFLQITPSCLLYLTITFLVHIMCRNIWINSYLNLSFLCYLSQPKIISLFDQTRKDQYIALVNLKYAYV